MYIYLLCIILPIVYILPSGILPLDEVVTRDLPDIYAHTLGPAALGLGHSDSLERKKAAK